jgi:hypothetical protein
LSKFRIRSAVARIPSADTFAVGEMARNQSAKLKDFKELMILGSCAWS